jgi:hypothetical protein
MGGGGALPTFRAVPHFGQNLTGTAHLHLGQSGMSPLSSGANLGSPQCTHARAMPGSWTPSLTKNREGFEKNLPHLGKGQIA